MVSVLRTLQAEWNTLVPQARVRGIPRVRLLNAPLETIAYRKAKLEWLKAQLGSTASFDTLTFGVEIECILPRGVQYAQVQDALRAAGVEATAEMYNHALRSHWKIVSDGSLHARNGYGCEVVSPPLRGEDGFAQLVKVCQVLVALRAKVNRSCGFHVHVGAASQHVPFFRNLVKLYASSQAAIDTFLSPSRRGYQNGYCRPVEYNEAALDRATTVTEVARASGQTAGGRDGSRYRKLNLQSFWQHGTVEFRHHQGTVEGAKAANWVRLVLRMCLAAMAGEKKPTTLDELFAAVEVGEAERTYFNSRVEHFRSADQRRS